MKVNFLDKFSKDLDDLKALLRNLYKEFGKSDIKGIKKVEELETD